MKNVVEIDPINVPTSSKTFLTIIKKLDKYSLNTEKISDGFDSDSHDDSSFMMYGSCAKTYNAKNEEPEVVSLSTEYDPNSTSR